MKNLFNTVKMTRPNRNRFDLTHDVKLSCNMGQLIPIMNLECVPGDKFDIGCESLLRFAPLVSPVMHRMDVTMHYFFVPYRLLWNNWENFITNTKLESTGELPVVPTVILNDTNANTATLSDYMGIYNSIAGRTETVNAFPFAAYQMIYNEYYRDQNLIPEVDFNLVDGNNTSNADLLQLRLRAWEHDYFTAALPFAQKGDPVSIPLGQVQLNDSGIGGRFVRASNHNYSDVGDVVTTGVEPNANITINGNLQVYDPKDSLEVGPTTINDLRRAFRLQEWLEKAARGGSRYIENILSFFGVHSSDKRLQRPEYITGTKSPVVISEVLNTTGTAEAPQGNMAGHGVSVTTGKYGHYFCEEHGCIIGIMSVMPKTAYMQGIERQWLKRDPFDWYWEQFAHIGEQEVKNKEIYAFTASGGDDTFGYVPRYAEYKFMNNRVAGDFRNGLNFWHLGRIFGAQPNLNQAFIECHPADVSRIFASIDTDTLWVHVLNKVSASRLMPKFGTPSF